MSIFDKLAAGLHPATAEEAQAIAEQLAHALAPDHHLALTGNLGAGKTNFVKGLARGWRIKESITSPTYSIYTIYQGERMLIHIDAYKLDSAAAFDDLMLDEFAHSPCHLVIEWPENIAKALPEPILWLELAVDENGNHSIKATSAP